LTFDDTRPETPEASLTGPAHRRRPEDEQAYLNRHQAAVYANCGLSLLHEATACGALRSIKLGAKRLYRRRDIDAWLEQYVSKPVQD
jgi:excisionase family DNA binding protein